MASQTLLGVLTVAMMGVVSQAAPPHLNGSHPFVIEPRVNGSLPFVIQPRVNFDDTCRCGQKAASRIVGGVTTGVNEWPWQAALMYGSQQFCGGSLINDRYVLTAAHCTESMRASDLTIRLAEHRLSTSSETSVVSRSVSQIIEHPDYQPGNEINDIALIKLSSPVQVSDTVLPVCMPPPNPTYAGKTATVTGWGTTSSGGSSSDTLREVDVTVVSNTACQSNSYGSAIKDTMLCAGSTGKDSCQGDSGGPLVFKDGGGNYDQIGVVSWGYGCGARGYPGVYTRVNSYLDWIKANTGDGVYCRGMRLGPPESPWHESLPVLPAHNMVSLMALPTRVRVLTVTSTSLSVSEDEPPELVVPQPVTVAVLPAEMAHLDWRRQFDESDVVNLVTRLIVRMLDDLRHGPAHNTEKIRFEKVFLRPWSLAQLLPSHSLTHFGAMGGGEDVSVVDEGSAAELLRAVHERRLPRPLVHARGHPAHDPGGGLLPHLHVSSKLTRGSTGIETCLGHFQSKIQLEKMSKSRANNKLVSQNIYVKETPNTGNQRDLLTKGSEPLRCGGAAWETAPIIATVRTARSTEEEPVATMASQTLLSVLTVAMMGAVSQAAPPHLNGSLPFVIEPRVNFDDTCRCGQKAASRIVGGVTTGVNEWPWQAALMYGSQQFCGGSLINDRYVLTAAHCTESMRASDLTIRLAEHRLSTSSETSVVSRSVSQIIEHPDYQPGNEINDIALIKLSSPVQVSDTVLPVCMPPPNPTYAGKTATVTGWGTTSSGGSSSDTLREVDVTVVPNTACQSNSYGSAIKDTMLCAGSTGKDSCQGDSGGPLVFKDGGGNYDQIGVVSWGYGCGARGYPGVYTRVNSYLDWIKANTGDGVYCRGMRL
nr:transmembrane protease serine 9-like [Penaeus vannamei]